MGQLIPDMDILLSGGAKKPLKELQVGDTVQTLHQDTLEKKDAKVSYVRVIDSPLLSLTLSGKEFICSEEDRFYATNLNRWVHASSLLEGDKISQLDGEVKFEGKKKIGKGESVELTVDDAHTYVCDGILMHNKGGRPSPPVVVIPPPPPPPEIVENVTPAETYKIAADSLNRAREQSLAYRDKWDAMGLGAEDIALRKAQTEYRSAQNARVLEEARNPSLRGPSSGAGFAGSTNGEGGVAGYDRLAEAEKALYAAQDYKTQADADQREVRSQREPIKPAWEDTDWLEIRKPYDEYNIENKIPYEDPGPEIYEIRGGKKQPVAEA